MQELVAVSNDIEAANAVAQATSGVLYTSRKRGGEDTVPTDGGAEEEARPFQALVRATSDDIDTLLPAAELGLYVVFSRVIRSRPIEVVPGEPSPGVTAVFALIHNPELTHAQADKHWRDTHAPLALKHHPGMWDYTQLSVVATLSGEHYDGFALVAFESETDLRTRFFGDENDVNTIVADVAKFADTKRSPRRVVATEHIFGQRPPVSEITWPHD